FKESKEIGYGKQQAGAEYPGCLPQYSPQRETEHHDLSAEWSQADGSYSLLRQVFGGAGSQRPGAIDLQARHLDRRNGPAAAAWRARGAFRREGCARWNRDGDVFSAGNGGRGDRLR